MTSLVKRTDRLCIIIRCITNCIWLNCTFYNIRSSAICNEEEKGNGSQRRELTELQLKLGLNQLNSTKLSLTALDWLCCNVYMYIVYIHVHVPYAMFIVQWRNERKLGLNQLNSTKLSLSSDSLGFSQTDYNWGNGIQRFKLAELCFLKVIHELFWCEISSSWMFLGPAIWIDGFAIFSSFSSVR